MASLNVVDSDGKELEKINISSEIIGQKMNSEILYQEVRRYLASMRSGTHNTKDRGEVRGGGRKPWRQKGTGNARAGSNRSPIWRGGGVVFGPRPRDYSFKLNKKVIRQSKLIALSEKFKDKKIIILDKLSFKSPETKKAAKILKKLNLDKGKVLMVFDNLNTGEVKSFRNIGNVMVESAKGLNAYIILTADYLVFTKSSLNDFIKRLENGRS
jgi:large subunit ribosomal protein L4